MDKTISTSFSTGVLSVQRGLYLGIPGKTSCSSMLIVLAKRYIVLPSSVVEFDEVGTHFEEKLAWGHLVPPSFEFWG